ncbi:hypothetical protein VNO77_25833 [Canavalia gladiata]|uniref:Uncharacterized protein n=1 Tax=Canavalia gladiata TaxID=3824 RepID=A0AAN9KU78_CANGL
MDKAARTLSGHNKVTVVPPSLRLVRSRSGSSPAAITTPERNSRRFSSSERFTNVQRSKSTSKSRTNSNEGMVTYPWKNEKFSPNYKIQEKKSSKDGFGKLLQRGVSPDNNYNNNNNNSKTSMRNTSTMKLASAWALSPGRSSIGSPINATSNNNNNGISVTKVFKYFKQRKVSSQQEEKYHQFRILHNRFLQWRFINARAEVAMANVNNIAQIQLFSVWLRILKLRKMTIQKRIELQRVKHVMKLYQILNEQLYLLTQWAQLERRNQESVGRLTRKLSALCTILPLTHDVKVDTESVFEALNTAIKVMDNIEPLIIKYQTQIERILYQVTELITTLKQEEEHLQELLGIVPLIATLLVSFASSFSI